MTTDYARGVIHDPGAEIPEGPHCLLLKLAGPIQSYGRTSRFEHRDTGSEPTKSAIVGLIANAMGRERTDSVTDLASLKMAVRIDWDGLQQMDYQTARKVVNTQGKLPRTIVMRKMYLADAMFLVALHHDDIAFLITVQQALRREDPRRHLYLGRMSNPVNPDFLIGIRPGSLEDHMAAHPWLPSARETSEAPDVLRCVMECAPGEATDTVNDQPVSFAVRNRVYQPRPVREYYVPPVVIDSPGEEAAG